MPDYSREIGALDNWIVNNQDKQGTPEFNAVVGDLKGLMSRHSVQQQGESITDKGMRAGQEFREDLSESAIKRGKVAFEIISAQNQGEQTWGETAYQMVTKVGIPAAFDVIGAGLSGALKGVSALTPDVVENPVKDAASYGAHYMLNAADKAGVVDALEGDVKAYQAWKEQNPRAARNFEGTANLALWFAPKIKMGAGHSGAGRSINNIGELSKRPSSLQRVANGIQRSGPNRSAQLKEKFVRETLTPIEGKRNMLDAVMNRQVTAGGFFTDKKYKFNDWEELAAREIMRTGVKPGDTMQTIWNAADDQIGKIEKIIKTRMSTKAKPGAVATVEGRSRRPSEVIRLANSRKKYDKKAFIAEIDDLERSTLKEIDALVKPKDQKNVMKFFEETRRLIKKNDNNGGGVYRARRQLDKWVDTQLTKKAQGFESDIDTAKSIAYQHLRNRLNGKAGDLIPQIKPLLQKQSALIRATGRMAPLSQKAAAEPMSAIMRQWLKVTDIVGLRSEFNTTMASLFGIGGLGAAAAFAPIYTAGLGIATANWAGKKLLYSKATKSALSELLKGTDEAIKLVGSTRGSKEAAELIQTLKADRAVIAQFLNEGLYE